jgi:hypothetical protein
MISVPTVISNVITRIRANTGGTNVGTYTNEAPYFDFGNHAYIANVLDGKDKSSSHNNKLYPFIGLILDIDENRNIDLVSYADLDLNIVLATGFDKTAKLSNLERETSSFKNVLYPLYEDLLVQMWNSHYFRFAEGNSGLNIPHNKTDLYYYDSVEGQNKWNRYVDAIELRFGNLKLNIETNC